MASQAVGRGRAGDTCPASVPRVVDTRYLETGPASRVAHGASISKHPDSPNADRWGAAGPLVWVLDGASQPPGSQCCDYGPVGVWAITGRAHVEGRVVLLTDGVHRHLAPILHGVGGGGGWFDTGIPF